MKTVVYSKTFVDNCDFICTEVISAIKEAYIKYYGEQNKGKIERVFNNLRIAFICDNRRKSDIKDILENISSLDFDSMDEYMRRKMQIKSGMYYSVCKNRDFFLTKNVLVYSSDMKHYKEDNEIIKSFPDEGCFVENSDNTLIYARLDHDGMLRLQTLVHEIGHALMKETLISYDDKELVVNGVYGGIGKKPSKIINELINEYITKEVMDMLERKFNYRMLSIDLKFNSSYLNLDYLHNDLVKRIYDLLREEIRANMINGNCNMIKRIINASRASVFDLICREYDKSDKEILDQTLDGRISSRAVYNRIKEDNRKENFYLDECYFRKVKLGYEQYKRDVERQDAYIDKMVAQGKARRLKSKETL